MVVLESDEASVAVEEESEELEGEATIDSLLRAAMAAPAACFSYTSDLIRYL